MSVETSVTERQLLERVRFLEVGLVLGDAVGIIQEISPPMYIYIYIRYIYNIQYTYIYII